jgi:hypothetical protein
MTIRTKRIIVDILMTIFFILSFEIRWSVLGGLIEETLIFHIIVGSVTAILFFIHVWINRQWLTSVSKARKSGKLTKQTKRQYRVDIALIVVWSINILSGLIVMGYSLGGIEILHSFRGLHSITATLGLVLVIVHIVQHMKQIKSYFRRRKPA